MSKFGFLYLKEFHEDDGSEHYQKALDALHKHGSIENPHLTHKVDGHGNKVTVGIVRSDKVKHFHDELKAHDFDHDKQMGYHTHSHHNVEVTTDHREHNDHPDHHTVLISHQGKPPKMNYRRVP